MASVKPKILIIMPAYNEASVIGKVIGKTKSIGFKNIVVVDDGSQDRTSQVATKAGATVLRHPINRGLGAALATGFTYANLVGADLVITLDSDGQHDPADMPSLAQPILLKQADVVVGSRLINPQGMPWYRQIGNWGLNLITYLLFGMWTSDSQSGLRAFSKKALQLVAIRTSRMEVSSEVFSEIRRHGLRVKEKPIRSIYTPYSLRKGQSNLNAFSIVRRLLFRVLSQA